MTADVDALMRAADAAWREGDHERALAVYARAEELGHVEAAREAGLILRELERFAEAEAANARGIAGGDTAALVNQANLLCDDLGRPEEALELYRRAVAAGSSLALANLGLALHEMGRADEAVRTLEESGSDSPLVLDALGFILETHDEIERAEAAYRRAVEAGHGDAASRLAGMLEDVGRSAEAEAMYGRAIELGNDEAPAYLGLLLTEQGRTEEAEAVYRAGLARGSGVVLLNFGNFTADVLDRPGEAEDLYRRAIDRGEWLAHLNLAGLLEERGEVGEAEEHYRTAVEDHGDAKARAPLLRLLVAQRRFTEAEDLAYRLAEQALLASILDEAAEG
jgi:tetratricopeptide (TPR) repeat protein